MAVDLGTSPRCCCSGDRQIKAAHRAPDAIFDYFAAHLERR